jgi:uncharacterized membrane protein YfcA
MTVVAGAGLIVLGVAVGAFGTLIGAGGGFLLVPLLLLLFHLPHPTAVGTSLALVFLNAASGTVAYLRQRRVDLSLGWKFAVATIPGAILGAFASRALSTSAFSLVFGIVLLVIAAVLASGRTMEPSRRAGLRQLVDLDGKTHAYAVDVWKGVAVSFVVGLMSSLLGIGGGIVHVPFLIVVLSLPVHVATATSHFILSISSFVGATTFYALGDVDVRITMLIGIGVLVGAQVGARASLRAGATTIRIVLAAALALVGLRMVLHAVHLVA